MMAYIMCLCVGFCICDFQCTYVSVCSPRSLLQVKATKAITAVPEWFQPSSWSGDKRLSLDLPKNEMKEWDKLVRRAKEIGEVTYNFYSWMWIC